MRFPAPYSPAGTTGRGTSIGSATRGSGVVPRSVGSAAQPTRGTGSPSTRTGSSSGKGPSVGKGKADSGPLVRYGDGPTRRLKPRSVSKARPIDKGPGDMGPSVPSGGSGKGSSAGKGAKDKGASVRPSGTPDRTLSAAPKNWRDVRRSDPDGAREIFVTTKLAGRAHDIGVGVATGAIGGVYAGGFRGGLDLDDDWVCDPWGWNGWSSGYGWSVGVSWGWGWGWCGPAYPWYWSWYYPCWWLYSRPYYYSDYCYYVPATRVVYAEPQVIYIERENEPVGEAIVSSQPGGRVALPAEAPSPLSIAAQRYLELGDRAFREGRYADAVQFYAKAVEFAPDQGALYLVLADALFAVGDYHYGAYAARRALELDPALIDSSIDKHGFYPDPAQFDAQLETLERYLASNPSDRDARLVLALNFLFGGRAKDAVRTLESAGAGMADDPAAQAILERARESAQG